MFENKQSSFIKLLEKDNSVSIHQRNLQILAIEMLKVSNGLPPVLMNDIFKLRGGTEWHQKCVIFRTNNMRLGTK